MADLVERVARDAPECWLFADRPIERDARLGDNDECAESRAPREGDRRDRVPPTFELRERDEREKLDDDGL